MSLGNPDHPVGGIAVRPPAGVELRPLGRADLPDALALAREQRELPSVTDIELFRDRYDRLINTPDTAAFLALADGAPVGLSALQFRRRLNFATFEGWLSDLYVRPAMRRRGIGRALLEALVAEWRLRGSHRMQAQVPDGAAGGRATLDRAGFEEWMLDFQLAPVIHPPLDLPEGVSLRPVRADDGEAVTRLIAEFGPHRSPVPDRMEAVLRTFAEHLRAVEAGAATTTIAELEGVAVGVCVMEWREPFWTDAVQAWIHDVVVTEPVRGRGIGRALMADALGRAVQRGAASVLLESGMQRESAHRLYRSLGFEAVGRTWVLRRDP
ncbi:MAG TPA: GNAT family N-acetyltransferase [Candidatus Limnocylindria bacterium]|nr:GNAT family N-acetyltransferase [Candidatus Limnocylindria bacterium]